ncbi:oligosaccharide flippase family protein [Lactiplantibacillus carotarum]|uniref:oligosaccharide flippase family protein n=1 Tax=Lactiplantibacillus carotarum TaxID=2993456 RepID=UPI00298EECA3|nr:oligosaccharide flippase family protein [Lactiplantibacillus carotarum]
MVIIGISPILNLLHIRYLNYFLAILVITSLFTLTQNFARAIGKTYTYAVAGIVNAFVFAVLNVIFLIYLKMNVTGYLASYFLAMLISFIFVLFSIRIWRYFKPRKYSIKLTKKMLRYSIPLIPNSLAWWLTNDASRYFILTFVGIAGNGLFAVANKIPTVINMFFNVFTQAWQISAVDEYSSKDRSEYYSNVFKSVQSVLFILVALFLLIEKPFMHVFVAASYYSAWMYIPILLLSVIFSNMSAFLGTVYLAAKRTSGIFIQRFSEW